MESSSSGQMTEAELARGIARLAILTAVVAAIGCGIYAIRPDVLPGWATDRVAPIVSPQRVRWAGLVIVAAVVTIGVLVWGSRRRSRRHHWFAASLTAELPTGYNPAWDCRSRRWKHGRPGGSGSGSRRNFPTPTRPTPTRPAPAWPKRSETESGSKSRAGGGSGRSCSSRTAPTRRSWPANADGHGSPASVVNCSPAPAPSAKSPNGGTGWDRAAGVRSGLPAHG